MKIISKHRDYYDYLVGVYGRDERLIYDRRATKDLPILNNQSLGPHRIIFSICGKNYKVYSLRGKSYFSEKSFLEVITPFDYWRLDKYKERVSKETQINKELRQPVLAYSCGKYYIPVLREFGIESLISAHDIYTEIEMFLGWLNDNPEAPQIDDNNYKIKSHGFDISKSFRNRK